MKVRREWLINMRRIQGFTQQEVADAVGIDRSTYAMYESGRRNPTVPAAQKVATFLKFEWTIFFVHNCGDRPQNKTA